MSKRLDITGQRWNRLVAVRFSHVSKKNYNAYWVFKCDCGVEKVINASQVKIGSTKSCGCLNIEQAKKLNFKDIKGQVFGKLTVNTFMYIKDENAYWEVICSCPNKTIKIISGHSLRCGDIKSCGCITIELQTKKHTTHGLSRTRFYRIHADMMARCYNPKNENYPLYGGRNITVCDRWHTFENYRDDRYQAYLDFAAIHGEKNTTGERIDPNGNYEPINHKWATPKEQSFNKRNSSETEDYVEHDYWKRRLTGLMAACLRHKIKKSKILEPYLGCTTQEFCVYIESLWESWMNWNNYGPARKNKIRWNIDHIESCYKFDLSKEEDRLICWNYKNLRPYDSLKNSSETIRLVTI